MVTCLSSIKRKTPGVETLGENIKLKTMKTKLKFVGIEICQLATNIW